MAVQVTCKCGETYSLKDEFAGKLVTCPKCGATSRAPSVKPQADPAFDRDKFLLHQKHWAIKEKYYVWDEAGEQIMYVERPAHLFRNLLAVLGGLVAALVGTFVYVAALGVLPESVAPAFALLAPFVFIGVLIVVGTALSKKRHVTFYRDDTLSEKLIDILQDQKFWILNASYTVRDKRGLAIARLRKNYLYNIFRKRWYCERPSRALWCVAKEDSIILSLLRRLLGPLFGLLRTNFLIYEGGDSEKVLGEFNRKATLLDKYVLDLSADPQRSLDRRVALALGVMLDTGERR